MRKTRITKKDILLLTISVFVVVASWIGFGIYHSIVTSTISSTLQEQIIPISDQFDLNTIDSLKARKSILPQTEFVPPTQDDSQLGVTPPPIASAEAQTQVIPVINGQP